MSSRTDVRDPLNKDTQMYYVYILASNSGTLYIGVTNNLERRLLRDSSLRSE
jgi:predicted GIY-YIG superfamily endonuclease